MENDLTAKELFTLLWERIKSDFRRLVKPEIIAVFRYPVEFFPKIKTKFKKTMFDIWYFVIILVLLVYGLGMHYSASLSSNAHTDQLKFAVIGIVFMFIFSQMRVRTFAELSPAAMALAFALLVVVLFLPMNNGTHRWIGNSGIQPSEFAKIALVMFFAYLMEKYEDRLGKKSSFAFYVLTVLLIAFLIYKEVHLSGTILVLGIGMSMVWYADTNRKIFLVLAAGALLIAAIIAMFPEKFIGILHEFQVQRIQMWKKILFQNGETLTADEKINAARQSLQSINAIGSGGFFGKGFGNSGQKLNVLSKSENDFIFAIVGEEGGFIGSVLMLVAFGALVFRGFQIAHASKSVYGRLFALGVSTQMALQVLLNVAVATGVFPNTGISLPFFSDGGSSLLVTLASMGMMLSVSGDLYLETLKKKAEKEKKRQEEAENGNELKNANERKKHA